MPGAWRRAAEKWRWQERAEAWDQAERERVQAEWRERQDRIRREDYDLGQALRGLARRILDEGPKFVKATRKRLGKGRPQVVGADGKVVDPGEPEQVVVTLALNGELAVKALEAASRLERLAAEMLPPKQAVELTGKDGAPLVVCVVEEIVDATAVSDGQAPPDAGGVPQK